MTEAVADPDPYEPEEGYPPDVVAGDQHRPRTLRQRMGTQAPVVKPSSSRVGKQKGKLTASKIMAKEKQRKALELRKGGATYDAIAAALGYADPSGARKAIERAMTKVIQEPALEVKTLQIERCNHMLLTLWPQVQAGDTAAVNTAIRVMQQLDAYTGANLAQQVDVNVHHEGGILVIDGSKDDYIAAMKRMVGVDSNGRNLPALPVAHAQPVDNPVDDSGDVVWADVVEDDVAGDEPIPIMTEGNTLPSVGESKGVGGKPAFQFGMDPERYKK